MSRESTKPAHERRPERPSTAAIFTALAASALACSSSPTLPTFRSGPTPDASVLADASDGAPGEDAGDGGVPDATTDGTSFADAAPLADATALTDADGRDAGDDSASSDAAFPGDSGLIDVATLPDASALDSAAPCGFLTCSPGCCTSAGECVVGTEEDACGREGQSCADCTQTNQTCQDFSCH